MQTRTTDAIPLAPRPSLEQYRKLAKDLVKASADGNVEAVGRWAKDWIERLARLQERSSTPEYVVGGDPTQLNWRSIEREVERIVRETRDAHLLERPPESSTPLARAQLFVARLHGFESWPRFVSHIEGRLESGSSVSQFESAADAVVTGNLPALSKLLRENPKLVRERSTREHRATLLHYVAANGHEGFRQRTPKNAVEIARLLLESGAEPDALAEMYDYQCTTMEMLVSSVHPHAAGVQSALVDILLDFGAAVDGVEGNGSPLMTALMFRYPKAARTLAARGAKLDNVITAAALGRGDLVDRFVDDRGELRPGVPLADVKWPNLPRDPKVHLGYALTWACAFGHDDVVKLLLRKGVDPSSRDGDSTALHYAAAYGRMELVRLLLEHGASLEALNRWDGSVLDATIWSALNSPVKGVDYAAVIRELIALGARDDLYPEMKAYVQAVLAGRRGGGYPEVGAPGAVGP
jgi:ankyrin repeat protein